MSNFAPPSTASQILFDSIIAPGGSWSGMVRRCHVLTITDLKGKQGVDFLCYSSENPEERYHAANTIKKACTLKLTTGHVLYSDIAQPMMTSSISDASRPHRIPAEALFRSGRCRPENLRSPVARRGRRRPYVPHGRATAAAVPRTGGQRR